MKKWTLLLPVLFFATLGAILPFSGKWELVKTKNKIEARSECGLAAVDGKLYLIGGDGPAMPVEIYDPATKVWSKGAMAPAVFHHFQAVAYDGKVYILDAFSDGGFPNQTPAANTWAYNTRNNTWAKLAGLPESRRRAGAGAALYKGKLYLVCGITHGHSSGTNAMFDVYDAATDTWTSLPDAPHIRDHAMAVVVKDKLYAVGGRNTSFRDPNNKISFFSQIQLAVDCYDFKTGKWTTLAAKLPMGTGGGTAVNLDNKIYYIGGERATDTKPNGPQKDVFYLDPETSSQWQAAPGLINARNGVGGTVLDHKIYIAGGVGGPGGPPPGGGPGGPPPGPGAPGQGNPPPPNGNPPSGPPPGSGGRPNGAPGEIALEVFVKN